jgi:hypothetical protein
MNYSLKEAKPSILVWQIDFLYFPKAQAGKDSMLKVSGGSIQTIGLPNPKIISKIKNRIVYRSEHILKGSDDGV